MSMKTSEEYIERLNKMSQNLYIGTERIERTDDRLEGGIRTVRETFTQVQNPKFQDVCTAVSHFEGRENQSLLSRSPKRLGSPQVKTIFMMSRFLLSPISATAYFTIFTSSPRSDSPIFVRDSYL